MRIYPWLYWLTGYVYIISGAAKILLPGFLDLFVQVGVPYPHVSYFVVAILEIGCGACIAGRFVIKESAAILIIIMLGALYFAKMPVLMHQGPLQFAFESRLDIVMLVILVSVFRLARPVIRI